MKKRTMAVCGIILAATGVELSGMRFGGSVVNIIQSIVNILIVFIVPGLCIAHIINTKQKDNFDAWEYINIATASSLLLVPLLLLIENVVVGKIYDWTPFLNTLILFVAAYYIGHKKSLPDFYKIIEPQPVLLFGIFGFIIMSIATAYEALPESDPYYWLQQYHIVGPSGIFFNQDRPFFYALNFLFIGASNMESYIFFKCVLPFLSIFTMVPVALVARHYKSYAMRLVVLSIPFFAPSTFLYSQIPFPQAISITLTYYFFFWLLYSRATKKPIFYYAAGLVAMLSYFYHEISLTLIIPWILVTISRNHKSIIDYIYKNKLVTVLATLLVISYKDLAIKIGIFAWYWVRHIFLNIRTTNWRFPAEYTNIDGNSIGWGNMLGVTKYYLYYVGPVLLGAILYFAYMFFSNKHYRTFLKRNLANYPEIQIIGIIVTIFLTISEVLPRLGGLAMLPERMWTVGSVFVSIVLLSLLEFHQEKYRIRNTIIVLALVCTSVGAIFYVNNLKKYVIPDYQIKSALWIKKNLPFDRTILSNKYETLIKVHSESPLVLMKDELYCNDSVQDPSVLPIKTQLEESSSKEKDALMQKTTEDVANYLKTHTYISMHEFNLFVSPLIVNLNNQNIQKTKQSKSRQNVYIYYAKDDPRNPYLSRPYAKKDTTCEKPSFANYPEQYTEIYNDHGNVVIWKVK